MSTCQEYQEKVEFSILEQAVSSCFWKIYYSITAHEWTSMATLASYKHNVAAKHGNSKPLTSNELWLLELRIKSTYILASIPDVYGICANRLLVPTKMHYGIYAKGLLFVSASTKDFFNNAILIPTLIRKLFRKWGVKKKLKSRGLVGRRDDGMDINEFSMTDGFCDGKTSNVASLPRRLSGPLRVVELGGLTDEKVGACAHDSKCHSTVLDSSVVRIESSIVW